MGAEYAKSADAQKLVEAFSDPRLQEYLATTEDPLVQGVLHLGLRFLTATPLRPHGSACAKRPGTDRSCRFALLMTHCLRRGQQRQGFPVKVL